MRFKLKNELQRLRSKTQEKLGNENMIDYVDDVLISSFTSYEMFIKLQIVLNVLKEVNLTLNIKK